MKRMMKLKFYLSIFPRSMHYLWRCLQLIPPLFLRNFHIKILTILVAFGLFLYVERSNVTEKVISVPLRVKLPKNVVIANELPDKVSFHLMGTKASIDSFDYNLLEASITILPKNKKKGNFRYKPIPNTGLPKSIQLTRIVPSEIEIKLASLNQKIVEIIPEFIHKPARGYAYISHLISPKRVKIQGPSEIIDSIVSLNTQPISLRGFSNDHDVEIKISKNINSLIQFNKDITYKVSLQIGPKNKTLSFTSQLVIEITGLSPALSYVKDDFPQYISKLKYQLLEETSSVTKSVKIQAIAGLQNIKEPGIYEVPVQIKYPAHWKIVSYTPSKISIQIILSTTNGENDTENGKKGTIHDID